MTPFYSPDLGPSAALYAMLAEDLVCLGHEVSVISTVPHYPAGRVAPKYRGRVMRREMVNGVDVTRVWVPSVNRERLGLRLLSFLCYQILAAAASFARPCDVVIASNPAFEVALPLFALGILRRKHLVYSVHEIYPDVGIKLGIFRRRATIRVIEWLEHCACRRAANIRVLSEGYKDILERRGASASKLAIIGDWVDTEFISPLHRRNEFSARWGLDPWFVVMYAGNLGPTQRLGQVLKAARALASKEAAIRFVLIGDGTAREGLQRAAWSDGLANVQFIPLQPRHLLPQILASADVSLVTLKRGLGADSVPSKCYSILASGRPAVACTDEGSDLANLIARSGSGVCVEPENPRACADAILGLYRNEERRAALGASGRAYVVRHHSRTSAARAFEALLRSAAPQSLDLEEVVSRGRTS